MLLVLLTVLSADGGVADAGAPFVPVVLDVNRGALWLNLPDGGVSDAPVVVQGGGYMNDETLLFSGKSEARGTAERAVSPDASLETVLVVAGVMLLLGASCGFLGGLAAAHKF